MVTQVHTSRAGRHGHVAAFLCGTFALALGLVLVLDPDDDDDQPLLIATNTPTETQAATKQATAPKQLKVAKTQKLKPKKTAFKKRGKRTFLLHESGPPVQASQRPRRGFAQAPHLVLPDRAPQLDVPDLIVARLQPGSKEPLHASMLLRPRLIRGPPLSVRS